MENFVGLAGRNKSLDRSKKQGKKQKTFLWWSDFLPRYQKDLWFKVDALGRGTGGPGVSIWRWNRPNLKHSKPGMLSMANAGPNTNGSQFFFEYSRSNTMVGWSSQFWRDLFEGYDVIEKCRKQKRVWRRPLEDISIKSVKIVHRFLVLNWNEWKTHTTCGFFIFNQRIIPLWKFT